MGRLKSKFKISRTSAAFTMIETISALLITAMTFSILGVAFESSDIALKQTRSSDDFEWAQFVDLIGSDNLALEFVAGENMVRFYSPTKDKFYRLSCKNNVLRMTGIEAGYMPLLYEVSTFTTKYEDSTLTMRVQMKGHNYICHIVMSKKEMGE